MQDYEERRKRFNEGLAKLIKECDIEPIPAIHYGASAIVSEIRLIDLRNPEILEKYGRKLIKKADGEPEGSEPETPANPLAN